MPTATTIEVTMGSAATGSASGGTTTIDFYYVIGPLIQTYGYGWGTNTWSGQTLPLIQTTLNGAGDAYGTGGSGTDIDLVSTTSVLLLQGRF